MLKLDESGRESTKMDENLFQKRWAGVKGLKNSTKMPQNPVKNFKSPIFQWNSKNSKKSAQALAVHRGPAASPRETG